MRFCCVTRYYHREARQRIQGANTVFPLVLTAQPSSRWVRSPLGIAGHRVRTCWVCGTAWHSLASQEFGLHILPFMIFSEISFLNVPCTWALMDFPGSPRQWAHRPGSRRPQGWLCFQAILRLFPGTREALCHLLSLFPKSKLSLVPGTLVHDHEDGNAKARKEKPSCFDANMLLKGCDSCRLLCECWGALVIDRQLPHLPKPSSEPYSLSSVSVMAPLCWSQFSFRLNWWKRALFCEKGEREQ